MEQKILILLRWQNQREEEEDEEVLDLESGAPISFRPSSMPLAFFSSPNPLLVSKRLGTLFRERDSCSEDDAIEGTFSFAASFFHSHFVALGPRGGWHIQKVLLLLPPAFLFPDSILGERGLSGASSIDVSYIYRPLYFAILQAHSKISLSGAQSAFVVSNPNFSSASSTRLVFEE